ncbi:MAG: phage tail assembly protein [Rhodobacteraceae bacterium]|nr:phage tail assembly protein [Paracoccaceae bacterium]
MAQVLLSRPILRGKTEIAALTLREPGAGEMRGLKLFDILQMDVSALIRLIPRISDPGLSEAEVAGLGPADIAKLGVAVVGFFDGAALTGPDTPTT